MILINADERSQRGAAADLLAIRRYHFFDSPFSLAGAACFHQPG
ncbi:hypothetical protein BN439_1627 [Erwinia amylovora Ea644]|nr:hypothetical protein BN439_1627 [Erwinia amylovora Ea644]CCP06720.1 hypothetical protein BN440_1688 [Erwinia amylovora MR1]